MKLSNKLSLLALSLFTGACSHNSGHVTGEAAYNNALDKAFTELAMRRGGEEGREVASDESVSDRAGADFSKLRGSIEVVVFPKLSNGTEKREGKIHVNIGRPITYTLNIQRNLKCAQLVRENTDKWSHKQFFADADTDLDCAILRVFQSAPEKKTANVRRGDIKEARLYIDSQYGVHGLDYEIMRTKRDSETVRVKTDVDSTEGSSGLGLLPIDLPPVNSAEARIENNKVITLSKDAYLQRKIRELGVSLSCTTGTQAEYKDYFGNINRTQWCRGDVWPTVVENANMIAILKRGK